MRITALEIVDLRIIERMKIEPAEGVNLITGDNGAGKTSVLEAIYLAARGRTFRHVDAGPMIRNGGESTTVVVDLVDEGSGRRSVLGARRDRKNLVYRLNGQDVKRRSELAEALPVQWIGSHPQQLFGLGPDVRRRFLDMGLFHVEHGYLAEMAEFNRVHQQRNAAIRQGDLEAARLWIKPFVDASLTIDQYRQEMVSTLTERAQVILRSWEFGRLIDWRYRSGWNTRSPLVKQLEAKLSLDLRMGFTTLGPQRGDLDSLVSGSPLEKTLSRGQQKIVVLALNLALIDLISEKRGNQPVLLLDDLASELDERNWQNILGALSERGCQVFLTLVDERSWQFPAGLPIRVFHVEHGAVPTLPGERTDPTVA